MSSKQLFKVVFMSQGQVYEVYARSVGQGDLFGFIVIEELVFGDMTSGARGDIKMATGLARKMVCEWGMSKELGMVEYGEHDDYVFLGKEISRSRGYSESTADKIDLEVKRLIDDAYARAKDLLGKNRDKLEAIAKALLEFETLEGAQVREIIEHGKLINPPRRPDPPELPEEKQPEEKADEPKSPDEDELPGGLAGAHAGA